MVLPEEVHPDKSKVQRSQTTGRLLVSMPKVKVNGCAQLSLVFVITFDNFHKDSCCIFSHP